MTVDGIERTLPANGDVTFANVSPGNHAVALSGIAQHCFVGSTTTDVQVSEGQTTSAEFSLECFGDFAVYQHTWLEYLDSNGELVELVPRQHRVGLWEWSPDGSKIVFEWDNNQDDLWVVNADASGLVPLTSTPDYDEFQPDWSPDGTKIAFAKAPSDGGEVTLWSMNADGSEPVLLADEGIVNWKPRWSPDGERLLFTSLRTGTGTLWVSNPDGSDPVQLTEEDADGGIWSPMERRSPSSAIGTETRKSTW